MDIFDFLRSGEGVADRLTDREGSPLVVGTVGVVRTVDAVSEVVKTFGQFRFREEGRDFTLVVRQEAAVFLQTSLQQSEFFFVNAARAEIKFTCDVCRRADRFAEGRAGCHDARAAHCRVGEGDVAPGEEQVGDVLRIQAAVRDAVRRGGSAPDVRIAVVVEAVRMVVVERPSAECRDVVKMPAGQNVALRHDVVADHAAGFALAGEEAEKVELPVVGVFHFTAVFDVIEHTVREGDELVAEFFGVGDGIAVAAEFQIPVVFGNGLHVRLAERDFLGRQALCPRRKDEFRFAVALPALDETAHAHRLAVCGGLGGFFTEFVAGFASDAVFRAGEGSENAVTGAVCEIFRFDFMPLLRGGLPAGDAPDHAVFRHGVAAGAVEKIGDVLFVADLAVEEAVPDAVDLVGIAVEGFELDLLNDAGLAVVGTVGTADPHTDLGRRVAAEHGAVLHDDDFGTAACRRDGRAHSGKPAADHAEVTGVENGFEHDWYLVFCNQPSLYAS